MVTTLTTVCLILLTVLYIQARKRIDALEEKMKELGEQK